MTFAERAGPATASVLDFFLAHANFGKFKNLLGASANGNKQVGREEPEGGMLICRERS